VADVWSHATRILTAGTNIVLAKGTGVTGFNDLSAAQVNAEVDTALADYDPPTKTELDAGFAALNNLSQAQAQTAAAAALTAYDPPTKAELDAAVAPLATEANVDAVEAKVDIVDTNVDTILAAVDTEIAAIKAKTDLIPANPAAVGSEMTIDMDQLYPTPGTQTEGSIGEALQASATELGDESVVGTEYTKKTPAGDTAATFDLDDADNPTTRTRQ
jgi:hypothetical protein